MDDDHDYDPDGYPQLAFTWSFAVAALILIYLALR
jgi:hypothetical protein